MSSNHNSSKTPEGNLHPPSGFLERQRRKRTSYDSKAMQARKSSILLATRAIIHSDGIDAVTLRRVGKEARVSVQTIYKAFGDRNRLIASTLEDEFLGTLKESYRGGNDLESIFSYLENAAEILPNNVEYTRILVQNYFSDNPDPQMYRTFRNFTTITTSGWMKKTRDDGCLAPWADEDIIISKISSLRFCVFLDWVAGRTPLVSLADELKVATLTILVGVTSGRVRQELGEHLQLITARLRSG